MTTTSELMDWFKSPEHIRTVLAIVEGVGGASPSTFYLSSTPYVTSSLDTPSNTSTTPCLRGGVRFSSSLSTSGRASISYGDLEIENYSGERDHWLNYSWTNRKITIMIGDPRWPITDFYTIFIGTVEDLVSKDRNTLNIVLVDKMQILNKSTKLNTYVSGTQVGGSDNYKPLLFGECFNISPILTNSIPNVLEYQVHDGQIERIIEVRDNGAPVPYTANTSTGTFTLTYSPYGRITCSAQGDATGGYSNSVPGIITKIVTTYGGLTSSDIDASNLASFEGGSPDTNPNPVGVFITDRVNIAEVCNQLASSIGTQVVFGQDGRLRLVTLDIPSNGATFNITENDILNGSLYLSDKFKIETSSRLAYCKNWTVQDTGLAGGLPAEHSSIFGKEWLYTTSTNSIAETEYNSDDVPDAEHTYLLTKASAEAEALRRNTLLSGPRWIVQFTGLPQLLLLNLGDNIVITHHRYGLNSKAGIVFSIEKDWIGGRAMVGVLV